jgi:hypothetical protein
MECNERTVYPRRMAKRALTYATPLSDCKHRFCTQQENEYPT